MVDPTQPGYAHQRQIRKMGGTPETADDQHHTLDEHAVGAHDRAWRDSRLDEMIKAHDAAARELADPLTGDRIVEHAAANGWPVVRCGEPCGFIATAPDAAAGDSLGDLLERHTCVHAADPDRPPMINETARTLINHITAVVVITLMLGFILALKGVIL